MMRILYIDVNCKYSSTGNIVYNLFSNCLKNGIEASICYGRGPLIKEKGIYKFGIDFETYIHAFLTRITGYTGCFSFFSTARLIRYIKRYKPNIVHIHELHAYFVNISQLLNFLKKQKIKTIFTNHCEFIYTGKCGHSKECTKYSDKCGGCPHLKDYPKSLFFDQTKHMLTVKKQIFDDWKECRFVSPSVWLNKKMDISFLKDKKRDVINNGIDTEPFSGNRIEKNSLTKKIILSVAPNIMSGLKGGERIIKLAKMFDDENVEFVLVGDTTKYDRELPANVKIFPLITNKELLIKDYYEKASIFLICSSFENFPTTAIEAQCCGLPICAFDVGGVSETILPGNGYLVDFEDYDSMKQKISLLLSRTIDRQEIKQKSIMAFSKETMFYKYLEIYKKML